MFDDFGDFVDLVFDSDMEDFVFIVGGDSGFDLVFGDSSC